jgi:hypothetical protein
MLDGAGRTAAVINRFSHNAATGVFERRSLAGDPQPRYRPLHPSPTGTHDMQITLAPIIALIAGILILVRPRLLNFIVAIYLIVIGLLGLFGTGNLRLG